ncbi:MAG: hypothetical protein ABR497_10260, partial [Kiritimatiellia bacterium]|nr:hypothetical protein [Lentisphaerota bacterium]
PYAWTGQIQMVLHAPQGWQTLSVPAKVFFEVPENARAPRIAFDGPVDVFTPDGELFGAGLSGWVELDVARPGLWSFAVDGASVSVDVENLPPYFAFDNPDHYFQPPLTRQ